MYSKFQFKQKFGKLQIKTKENFFKVYIKMEI